MGDRANEIGTVDRFKELRGIIDSPDYTFLKTNKHLGDKVILLTLAGSHANGTSTPTSDIDIRGITLNSKSDLLGLTKFEQYDDESTDSVIYSFNKYVKLAMAANPSILEILGLPESDYLYLSDEGRLLIENRGIFLSKLVSTTFGGYATDALHQLNTLLNNSSYTREQEATFVLKSLAKVEDRLYNAYGIMPGLFSFVPSEKLDKKGNIIFTLKPGPNYSDENMRKVLSRLSLNDLQRYVNELLSITRSYRVAAKRAHRVVHKGDYQINKHAMHLVRLYLMAIDILKNHEIITYRKNDLDLLLKIRNGYYYDIDAKRYKQEFFELVESLEAEVEQLVKTTDLPELPDTDKINKLMIDINSTILLKK